MNEFLKIDLGDSGIREAHAVLKTSLRKSLQAIDDISCRSMMVPAGCAQDLRATLHHPTHKAGDLTKSPVRLTHSSPLPHLSPMDGHVLSLLIFVKESP